MIRMRLVYFFRLLLLLFGGGDFIFIRFQLSLCAQKQEQHYIVCAAAAHVY